MSTPANLQGKHESEILLDVLHNAINAQRAKLECAFKTDNRALALQYTGALTTLYEVLHDMEDECDKYGFYH